MYEQIRKKYYPSLKSYFVIIFLLLFLSFLLVCVQDTDLHKCAYRGEHRGVLNALSDGVDVNALGAANRTALHRAVSGPHPAIVELLLRRGADLRAADRSGRTPLHWAAVVGSVECGALLLDAGADPEAVTTGSGATPLHMAADSGQAGFVEFMVARGADPESKDKGGLRPVDLAKNGNYAAVVAVLPRDEADECLQRFWGAGGVVRGVWLGREHGGRSPSRGGARWRGGGGGSPRGLGGRQGNGHQFGPPYR